MRISVKKQSTSLALTGAIPADTPAEDLATELTTNFPSNPPGYDPAMFGGLAYEEIAAKLASIQPPHVQRKTIKKKKNQPTPILIEPSPPKNAPTPSPSKTAPSTSSSKKAMSPSPSIPEDVPSRGEEEEQDPGMGSEESKERIDMGFTPSQSEERNEEGPHGQEEEVEKEEEKEEGRQATDSVPAAEDQSSVQHDIGGASTSMQETLVPAAGLDAASSIPQSTHIQSEVTLL